MTASSQDVGATKMNAGYAPAHRGDADIDVHVPPQRGDQVRWGPVWAGLVVALPTFLLGGLILLAVGVLDVGDSVSGGTAGVLTGFIGLLAFFLGGLTAAATAMWRGVDTGLLHGILVWALGVLVILGLSLLGAGALLGSLGNIAAQVLDPATIASAAGSVDPADAAAAAPSAAEAAQAGQSAASWAVLSLGLTFIASAAGGLVGAKFWPRAKGDDKAVEERR